MIVRKSKSGSGIFFKLEREDFKFGDWRGFLAGVKRLEKWAFNPPELGDDIEAEWWWIGNESVGKFLQLKESYLDIAIRREKQFIADGYRPIPRARQKRR